MIDQERSRQTAEHNQFKGYALPERHAEKKWADSARDDIYGGYKGFSTGESLGKPGSAGFGAFSGGGGGGGYTPQTYSPEKASLSGYSREAAGGYSNFANTGGWSTGDITRHRDRAMRTSDAYYDSLQTDLERQKKLSGGNLAFTGSLSRLARQKAQTGQASLNDAELGMQANIRENKLAGLGGLAGVGDTDTGVNLFNTTNENEARKYNISEANSAAASGAASSAANARWLAEQDQQERMWRAEMQMAGLGGMHDMYTSNPAELARYDDQLMRSRFGQGASNNENLNLRAQYNPKGPSAWDRAFQVAGAAAGLGGAFLNPGGLISSAKASNFLGQNVGIPKIPGRG